MVDYTNSDGFVTDDQGRRQYANRDDAALIEGTEIDATDHNEVRNELVYLVSQSGLTPSNENLTQVYAAVQKLVAAGASEAAVGFTPVEQGGVTGLTSDKINIGNSTNGLAAYIAGTYYGVLATQAWANSKFVANNGGTNGGIVSATIDGGTKTPSFLDGSGTWTQVASYSGLQAEISRATTVESNLQTSIGQKVDKSGDTMMGPLTVKSFSGITASGTPSSANTGDYINYPAFISSSEGRGGTAWLQLQEHVGTNFTLLMGVASGGNSRYFGIPQGARANDSAYGDVAYTSDLSSYVPSSTYASDFSTSDSQVINLPYGSKIQRFVVSVPTNGTNSHRITYPEAFSGAAVPVFNGNDNSQSRSFSLSNNTTPDATGFDIAVSVHGNSTAGSTDAATLTVIAIGPR
ncbi:hypothetical protein [Acetobacter persici]|uniref:hypothetical protein n=1 Tax=Acetobacter persici TaxID=1076596 RepID=UPI001BA9C553|nr:hypothetical protein [Acetobacter persici]MBS1016910.1 hypothetical protein [Acetobacter persici]